MNFLTGMTRLLATTATAMVVAMTAVAPAAADGDPGKGEKLYKKCATCHSLEAGKNKIGPSLAGVFGRVAGSVDGFKYSEAMKGSGIAWNEDNLDAYLAKPKEFIPGNKMVFVGFKKEDDREDLIAYLRKAAQ